MIILNLTYHDRDKLQTIYSILGRPYGFFQSIAIGGTGSPPLHLLDGPEQLLNLFRQTYDKIFSSMELFPQGLLFRFHLRLENFGIPLPFIHIREIVLEKNRYRLYDGTPYLLEFSVDEGGEAGNFRLVFGIRKNEIRYIRSFFNRSEFQEFWKDAVTDT